MFVATTRTATTGTGDGDVAARLLREAVEVHAATASDAPTMVLRYGENPHQEGVFVGDLSRYVTTVATNPAKPLLSYNNLLDVDSAIALMADFLDDGPTAAVLKHGIPCVMASSEVSLVDAWTRALEADSISPFGGVAVFNRALDVETARAVGGLYLDVVLAPAYEEGALKLLPRKTVLKVESWDLPAVTVRGVLGGLLAHRRDRAACVSAPDSQTGRRWEVATTKTPTDAQTVDLIYAERLCKHVKSNAVVLVKDRRLVAAGAAQPCRVGAVEVAVARAARYPRPEMDREGMVMASDAYFPFPDGPGTALTAGVVAIVQPGGSRGDTPSVAACEAQDASMVLTNQRHFRH
jgi:phosphoribosylaminoimidazolecarboxamide formyltransferase/IMP cyclohydrolase